MNKVLCNTAITYADLGWRVMPLQGVHDSRCACGKVDCSSPGKHPHGRFAPQGLKNATLDGGAICQWFANGEIRRLPEKVVNEWSENLVGAQYLDFPEISKIHVSVRIKAVQAGAEAVQLTLNLRQYEYLVTDIAYPPFPLLHAGEETEIAFDFDNPEARQAFSFHLFGEGRQAAVQIEEFNVTVDRRGS
jgi:hypothetical protein